MRRLITATIAIGALALVASTLFAMSPASSLNSPYPAVLTMHRGLTMSNVTKAPPWGTTILSSQTLSVTIRSTGPT
jgi:hypothetical protein